MKLYTVREAAKQPDCPFSERWLRQLISEGRCPGIRVGNRFMIDIDTLNDWIKCEALREVAHEQTATE